MISLQSILSDFSPEIISKIEAIQNEGEVFLNCLQQFPEAELVDMLRSPRLFQYMVDVLLNATEDTAVHNANPVFICRNYNLSRRLFFTV